MDANKLTRLNYLFEKAVNNNAKLLEKRELAELYSEYINEGRDHIKSKVMTFSTAAIRTAS